MGVLSVHVHYKGHPLKAIRGHSNHGLFKEAAEHCRLQKKSPQSWKLQGCSKEESKSGVYTSCTETTHKSRSYYKDYYLYIHKCITYSKLALVSHSIIAVLHEIKALRVLLM